MTRPLAAMVATVHRPSVFATVDSLLLHTGEETTVVVLNQGGTRFPAHPRLVILDLPDRGLSTARNAGLDARAEPYVAFLDDDCVSTEGWSDQFLQDLERDPTVGVAFGQVLPSPSEGATLVSEEIAPGLTCVYGVDAAGATCFALADGFPLEPIATPCLHWARLGSGNNFCVSRRVVGGQLRFWSAMGPGTDLPAGEDTELIHRLLLAGVPMHYTGRSLAIHDSWIGPDTADTKVADYFVGGYVALRGSGTAIGDELAALQLQDLVHSCPPGPGVHAIIERAVRALEAYRPGHAAFRESL